jgi:cytochrome b involved in lipid metabolism
MQLDPVTLVAGFLGVALFVLLLRKQQQRVAGHVSQLAPSSSVAGANERRQQKFTREEVARHCHRHDAWIIVQDKQTGEHKVYDVTQYVDEHPGGDSILNNAGRDATEGFLGPQHPDTVFVMVDMFQIGTLSDA